MAAPSSVKELKYRLEKAQAREAARAAKRAASPKAYTAKSPSTDVYWRSAFDNSATLANDTWYVTPTPSGNLSKYGGTDIASGLSALGLLDDIPNGAKAAIQTFKTRVHPSMIKWFYGDATPVRETTSWGTSYIKFYDKDAGQSHRSAPTSRNVGAFTLNDLVADFYADFKKSPAGPKRGLLGERGVAEFVAEKRSTLVK